MELLSIVTAITVKDDLTEINIVNKVGGCQKFS